MDQRKFDDLVKTVAATTGRRGVIRGIIAGAASAGLTLVRGHGADARCRSERCKRRGGEHECCGGECVNLNRDERNCGRCE